MNILLTGASGLVGSILKDGLKEHTIIELDIKSGLDIRNKVSIEHVFESNTIDCVIHAAALKDINESFVRTDDYYQTNVVGTRNLIELADKYNVGKFIFMSSGSIVFSRNPYTFFKEISEHEVLNRKVGSGICLRLVSVLKTFGVYQVNQTSLIDNMLRVLHGKLDVFKLFSNTMRKFVTPEQVVNKIRILVLNDKNSIARFEDCICINTKQVLEIFIRVFGNIKHEIVEHRHWESNIETGVRNVHLMENVLKDMKHLPVVFS